MPFSIISVDDLRHLGQADIRVTNGTAPYAVTIGGVAQNVVDVQPDGDDDIITIDVNVGDQRFNVDLNLRVESEQDDPVEEPIEPLTSLDFETGTIDQWLTSSGASITTMANQMGNSPFRLPSDFGGASGETGLHGTMARVGGSSPFLSGQPGRRGEYQVRFRLPNQSDANTEFAAEGLSADPETGDYRDPAGGNYNRRRTEVRALQVARDGNFLNSLQTRWVAFSVYIPSDWQLTDHGEWGPYLLQVKGVGGDGVAALGIILNAEWEIQINWSPTLNPTANDVLWQWIAVYKDNLEASREQLKDDFPDVSASESALASVNRGGWTDWALRCRFDPRSNNDEGTFYSSGGEGSIDIYKREDAGSWIHVIEHLPRTLTVGEETFSRGVMVRDSENTFYPRTGFYGNAQQILNANPSREYLHNGVYVFAGDETLQDISDYLDGEA